MDKLQPRGVVLDRVQFCCSVCLELLKEPVTIGCGHSYCRSCIESCWDEEASRRRCSCPLCRETFRPRPVLRRNNMLAELVEKLTHPDAQDSPPAALTGVGQADVACDFCCAATPDKATASCLTCLASYCPAHLQPHYSVPVLKKHQLVSATARLQEKLCTKHNKLMEVYCQNDNMCICYLCAIDEHRGHSTVSAAAVRAVEQKRLIAKQKGVQGRFQEREKELGELCQALNDFKSDTQAAMESCDLIFEKLVHSIKKRCELVKQLVRNGEETAVAEAEKLQQLLEGEIAKLRRRDADLEQLVHTADNVHFIQTFQSFSTSCESPDLPPGSVVRPRHSVKTLTDCVSELSVNIENLLKDTWPKISATDVVLPPVPKTRAEFLRYSCPLSLDPTSVNKYLSLSHEQRRVTNSALEKPYFSHSDRFTSVRQVLCREALSERCYWEVALSAHVWSVAVSYRDICRSSPESEFGENKKSWSLLRFPDGYAFCHHRRIKEVSGPQSSRIGVYLDYKSGTLSFYSVSDTMTLLHKEHATFTQPLHPGLGLNIASPWCSSGHKAELIKLW